MLVASHGADIQNWVTTADSRDINVRNTAGDDRDGSDVKYCI